MDQLREIWRKIIYFSWITRNFICSLSDLFNISKDKGEFYYFLITMPSYKTCIITYKFHAHSLILRSTGCKSLIFLTIFFFFLATSKCWPYSLFVTKIQRKSSEFLLGCPFSMPTTFPRSSPLRCPYIQKICLIFILLFLDHFFPA